MSDGKLIFKKMALILGEISSVGKNSTNSAQGYKFRGIDDMVNATHVALKKHGVFITTDVVSKDSEVREVIRGNGKAAIDKIVELTMKYTFHAEDGSSISSTIASEGLDSGDKATNKALSAALKYALIQTFQIPTEDMEEADMTSPVLEAPPKKTLVQAVAEKQTAVVVAATNAPDTTVNIAKRTVAFKPKATKPLVAPVETVDNELDL